MSTYDRARQDAQQDSFENAPFACVGGLSARANMLLPDWIEESEREEYLRGYRDQCLEMYGEDWRTCSFGWQPALMIDPSKS